MAARKTANGKATVAHFDEIPSQPQPDTGAEWKPVRHFFDLGSFGASLYVGHADGEVLTSEHSETGEAGTRHEELFYVAQGRATFVVDGEEVDAPAGTFVYVRDPDVRRGAVAREPGTVVLVAGGAPGEAYEVSPWEREEFGPPAGVKPRGRGGRASRRPHPRPAPRLRPALRQRRPTTAAWS